MDEVWSDPRAWAGAGAAGPAAGAGRWAGRAPADAQPIAAMNSTPSVACLMDDVPPPRIRSDRPTVRPSGYFTSSNTNGAPTGSMRSNRRGRSRVTCMTTGSWRPDSSSRYAGNVPAGTVTFSTPATFTVSSFVTPSLDENTLIVKVLPSARGRAGRIACSWLSSTVPGATTVSTWTVLGVPSRCGVTARPLTRPFAYVRCTSAGCVPAVPVWSTCRGANVVGSSTTVVC